MLRKLILSISFFSLCMIGLWSEIHTLSRQTSQSQLDSLREALTRSTIHFYAVEGRYPSSLEDLKEAYGLSWDTDKYLVDYELIGSNVMPGITVFAKSTQEVLP